MSHFHSNTLLGASGNQGYEIERSLRFNSGDSAHLTRTPSSASNSTTFTWSAWIKVDSSTSNQTLFSATSSGTLQYDFILTNNQLNVYGIETVFVYDKKLSRVFRDPSAWYHLVVAFDTTDSTPEDRIKIYVNGERETDFATNTNPSASRTTGFNKTVEHSIGGRTNYSTGQYSNGYQTEINFIDGSQLGPGSFGETDSATGAWIPKKYSGAYGTNGFYLNFSDNSGVTATTLGKDSSGNGNNWTPVNLSVTAGTGNDSLEDTPTNNWCTLNPLNRGVDNPTVSDGNLLLSSPSTDHTVVATFGIPSSGKWYWEYSKTAGANLMSGIIYDPEVVIGSGLSTYLGGQNNGYSVYAANGQKYTGAIGNQTYMATPPTSTTITVAFDADTNELYFGADGNWGDGSGNTNQTFANAAVAYTVPTGKTYYPAISFNGGNAFANFGQRPFDHTPPTGYKALNAANLAVPTIKDGTEYFNTVLWTGNSSTQAITGVGFQPDFVWGKARSVGYAHNLFDAVRGATKSLVSSSTAAEITLSGLTSFDSDGFTLGSNLDLNLTTHTYVAWNWKANGSGSANTDGTISSTVSVNAEAGFSIVSYTGSGANATIGHGLGVAPSMMIVKNRDRNASWAIYHGSLGATKVLQFDTNSAFTDSTSWNNTSPTSSVFTIGTANSVNASTEDIIAYCFAEVEGYSKFGSYTGNGSANGPFVACGFRPSFLLIKRSSAAGSWFLYDAQRDTHNSVDDVLFPDLSNAEASDSSSDVDFLSNGFKIRTVTSAVNTSAATYIFMAFAETPFKHANAR